MEALGKGPYIYIECDLEDCRFLQNIPRNRSLKYESRRCVLLVSLEDFGDDSVDVELCDVTF